MINEYFRPASIDEALSLLTEDGKDRRPLGGGTSLSRNRTMTFGVVDLQGAGMDQIIDGEQELVVGALVRLDCLLAHPGVHPEVKRGIRIDASENIRNMATLGGWLVSSDGRSVLTTVLLALDSTLNWEPGNKQVRLGDWLPLRQQNSPGVLMKEAAWWLGSKLAFEYVARSPKDRPIVVVAVAQWGSGRTRVALGGYGAAPIVAMDGPVSSGAEIASQEAYFNAGDQWATAQYRREVAAKLTLRCLQRLDDVSESEA